MLTYEMVKRLCKQARGIVDDTIQFRHVFVDPHQHAPKGLFIPLGRGAETLKIAIENGAIAALWQEEEELPRYIPNQFPLFFVTSPLQTLEKLLDSYMQWDSGADEKTIFHLTVSAHNGRNDSYDIAVFGALKRLQQKWMDAQGKEGCDHSC
jgi:UDP-N-acetylmuramyl pentapeptide synthase